MHRLVFLGFTCVAFFYFYSFLERIKDKIKEPPETPSRWSQKLKEETKKIAENHPRHLVSAALVLESFNKKEVTFIDVRTPEEQEVSTIPGAIKVAPGPVNDRELPWKNIGGEKPLIVYCTIGERSAQLKDQLRKKGWAAFNMIGGICAWSWENGPLIDANGEETKKIHTWSEEFRDCVSEPFESVY